MTSNKFDEMINLMAQELDYSDVVAAELLAKISATIVGERLRLNMSQKEFADHMNVSQYMVSKWESGNHDYSIEELAKIFEKLNLKWDIEIER